MVSIGSILIIISIVLWFFNPLAWLFGGSPLIGIFYIMVPIIVGIAGIILTFLGVLKDRVKEHKNEEENNDYRKY